MTARVFVPRCLSALVLMGAALTVVSVSPASAQGAQNATCVSSNATTCVATIPLVANMDVDITFLLPANNGFSLDIFGGTRDSGATWTSLDNGSWSGTGTTFTALLQTGSSVPVGADVTCAFDLTPRSTTSGTGPKALPRVTVVFTPRSGVLSASAKRELATFASRLDVGAHVTFEGWAPANGTLARRRAVVVETYVRGKVSIHPTVTISTSSTLNRVTVSTTSQ